MLTIESLRRLLGPGPKQVPLDAQVIDSVPGDDFERVKVDDAVGPAERISAYLLVPNHAQRAPAIFCHHQHASNFAIGESEIVGLAGGRDQALAPELAKRGYVVIAPDVIAFEEGNGAFRLEKLSTPSSASPAS